VSAWTHSICDHCWERAHGNRVPVRLHKDGKDNPPAMNQCCFCITFHHSGIFTRADPKLLPCEGRMGMEHEDAEA
jgi:hypothetical protein